MITEKTIPELEAEYSRQLHQVGHELFFDSYRIIHAFVNSVIGKMPDDIPENEIPKSVACTQILMRIMQDFRASHLLVTSGYPYSAGSLVSSMLEMSYEIGWLINDKDGSRIEGWHKHEDLKKTVENYYNRMQNVLSETYDHDDYILRLNLEKEAYTNLCAMKHGNSILLRDSNLFFEGEDLYLTALPIYNRMSLDISKYVTVQACRIAIISVAFFADGFIKTDLREEFTQEFLKIDQYYKDAHQIIG
jgi:hypothetical protein